MNNKRKSSTIVKDKEHKNALTTIRSIHLLLTLVHKRKNVLDAYEMILLTWLDKYKYKESYLFDMPMVVKDVYDYFLKIHKNEIVKITNIIYDNEDLYKYYVDKKFKSKLTAKNIKHNFEEMDLINRIADKFGEIIN